MRITRSGSWRIPSTKPPQLSPSAAGAGIGILREAERAATLLQHPLRLEILAALLEPDSATGVARRMSLPRQTVNYHVRALARAGLLARAGRRRRRRMFEQCYVATARGFVLSPELLGDLAADPAHAADSLSAKHLLGLTSKVQAELARSMDVAAADGKGMATFSVQQELKFNSTEQWVGFTEALQRALAELTERHGSPHEAGDGSAGEGHAFRVVLGCYPVPPTNEVGASKEGAGHEARW